MNHEYDVITLPEEYFRDALASSQSEVEAFLDKVSPSNLSSMENTSKLIGVSSSEFKDIVNKLQAGEKDPMGIEIDEIPALEDEIRSSRKTAQRKDEWRKKFKGEYKLEDGDLEF